MLNYAVALLGLLLASYTDLKERIVPDSLNYFLFAFGFLYHLYLSITTQSFDPILFAIGGATIAFVFSYILWRIGAWAGGDVKLFTALGMLVPGKDMLFPFAIFINAILLSFPFLLLYIFYKTAMKKSLRKVFKRMLAKGFTQGVLLGAYSTGFFLLLPIINLPQWLGIPLIILAFLIPYPVNFVAASIIGAIGFLNPIQAVNFFAAAFFTTLFWQAVSYGKEHALRIKLPLSKLKDGMISAETLYLSNKKVKKFLPSLKQKLTFYEPSHTIVSMYKAAGIEKREIASLKKHKIKHLWIKESLPMIPIIFFGALAATFLGNLILLLINLI